MVLPCVAIPIELVLSIAYLVSLTSFYRGKIQFGVYYVNLGFVAVFSGAVLLDLVLFAASPSLFC